MPWCPNCRCEYREGYNTCSDCQVELVEALDTEAADNEDTSEETDEWAFLTRIKDDREVDIIESLLRSFEIPLLRRYREAGGYLKVLTGMSVFGVDLFVPKSKLELAREIIKAED